MVCADQCPLLLPIKGTQLGLTVATGLPLPEGLGLTVADVGTTAAGRELRVQTEAEYRHRLGYRPRQNTVTVWDTWDRKYTLSQE